MLKYFILFFCLYINIYANNKVAVIAPLEHKAILDIYQGIKDNLPKNLDPIFFNTMNDSDKLNSIIKEIHKSEYSYILPIGHVISKQVLNQIKNKTIICLAVNELPLHDKNIFYIKDDINIETKIEFIKKLKITNPVIIRSHDSHIYYESNILIQEMTKIPNTILNINESSDILDLHRLLHNNTNSIIILKDNIAITLIPMIKNILKQINRTNVMIITFDEGSVKSGADIALGIDEYNIGVQGSLIIEMLLSNKITQLPVIDLTQTSNIFINSNSLFLNTLKNITFNFPVKFIRPLA